MVNRPDHVVVVDDDPDIRTLLASSLERRGFRVSTVDKGMDLWTLLESSRVDLVVLDLGLPDEDGLEICRTLRGQSSIPIIILTARSEEVERIIGLEMGADDYVVKPVSPREILARIKTVLRRTRELPPGDEASPSEIMRFSGWTLNAATRRLTSQSGREVVLTHGELRLLRIFLGHPNRVLSRDQLLDLTQGHEADPFDRSIDILVSRLRKRLQDDPKKPRIIQTVRGEGYILSVDVEKGRFEESDNSAVPAWLGKKAVAADAEQTGLILLAALLEDQGCQVLEAPDVARLTEILAQGAPDIIFADRAALEAAPPAPNGPPTILLAPPGTAGAHPLPTGVVDLLEKPILPHQVQGVLRRHLPPDGSMLSSQEGPVDFAILKSLRTASEEGLTRAIDHFLKSAPKAVKKLRGETGAPLEAGAAALGDAAASLGGKPLYRLSRRMGDYDAATPFLDALNDELQRLLPVLREELSLKESN